MSGPKLDTFTYNYLIDKLVKPTGYDELSNLRSVTVSRYDLNSGEYRRWLDKYIPRWEKTYGTIHHKKPLEFFISFKLLELTGDDIFLDAAGGGGSYIEKTNCIKLILQDMVIADDKKRHLSKLLGSRIVFIEGNAGQMALPDNSVDKISCHHSFEHFQENADSQFISEVQRLLRLDGKCCIIPIFLADKYVEVTREITFDRHFDPQSHYLIDPTASIPGWDKDSYARIYDPEAFTRRVLDLIDRQRFDVSLLELSLDGNIIPDLTIPCHEPVTAINRPYRALLIRRVK